MHFTTNILHRKPLVLTVVAQKPRIFIPKAILVAMARTNSSDYRQQPGKRKSVGRPILSGV